MESKPLAFGFLVVLIAGIIALSGCLNEEETADYVEITEYEGEKLSSINDFRENAIKGPQYLEKERYVLKITGLVENPGNYTYEEIINTFERQKKVVKLDCVEGWSVTIFWEGVVVSDLLEATNPSPNAKVIIFHAYDGYTTSFPIEYIKDNRIIMAYMMNNVTLPPERGFPFQLVAESKWGYKWIKWITEIELSDDVNRTYAVKYLAVQGYHYTSKRK
jgi:DMSO/TMAO reductase YedYZ molybdopterin-dependent catalytic subunit